jgi:manganese oxidase
MEERRVLNHFAALTSVAALLLAALAVVFAGGDDDGAAVSSGGGGAPIPVTLSEFAISPSTIEAPSGEPVVLDVTNSGSAVHNLALKDGDARTDDLDSGASQLLDLGTLEQGTYTLICEIAGHEGAGMTASLVVGGDGGDGGETAGGGHAGHGTDQMSFEEMDRVMKERTGLFPAETEGLGGQPFEPTVLDDGTKEFTVTTEEIDWEVEPGKVVKAMAYNGQVPGPVIKVDVGDKVRIVLQNEMSESTAIHFHGIRVPNKNDGVPDITQPPVEPGEEFVYEFTAMEPAVGIYHSHHHAEVQVPNGLFGAFLVGEMPVPAGTDLSGGEHVMVLNDAGTIGYSLNGKSFPATAPYSLKQGQSMVIHYLNEGLQAHPMHLHGPDQLVIAKDGNPLPTPYLADTVNVAPGERYTVLVTGEDPGVWAFHCHILTHAEASTGMFGMVTALIVE